MLARYARLASAAMVAGGLLVTVPATAQTKLTYFTGPTGGSWIPISGALTSVWQRAIPGLSIENRPGAGLINMKAIEEGKAEIGMGNMISTVDALAGKGQGITQPYKNICHLASLYPQVQQITVRGDKGIESIADLKGKSVGTLPRGNTTAVVAEQLMDIAGVGFGGAGKMNFVSIADQANMFKDGQIDASLIITTVGSGAIMDMANSRPIKMLDIPDDMLAKLKQVNSGFERYVIPKGTYPGMTADNLTVQFPAHVIISCKLPDDIVYQMAKSMTEALPDLVSVNAAFKGVTVKDFGAASPVPFHPGAAKYFKEKGVL